LPPSGEWDRCRPYIEAALTYAGGTHELSDIEAGIQSGRFGLYPLANAALIAEIIEYPRLRALHIFLAGGDLEELKFFTDRVLPNVAREFGCSRITIAGRKGFARVLRDIGFQERWTVLSKEV
jgi:hypothetical protein